MDCARQNVEDYCYLLLGYLKTHKSTGTSCQIEIIF